MDWRETLAQALMDSLMRLFSGSDVSVKLGMTTPVHYNFCVRNAIGVEEFRGVLCADNVNPHILWSDHYRWTFKDTAEDMYLYIKNLTREEVERMVY